MEAVFRAQTAIFQSGDFAGGLRNIALSAGLSEEQWKQCISDEAAQEKLRDRVDRNSAKAKSTPTFYVNDKLAKEGVMTLAELDAAIAAARAAKK